MANKRRTLKLGGLTYSIKDAKQLCKLILHQWPLYEILVGEEFDIIRDVYDYHPEIEDLGIHIESIKVSLTRHMSGNTHRAFHIKRYCDFDHSFRPSYLRCFCPSPRSHKAKVTDALRSAVQYQIDNCRIESGMNSCHVHREGVPFAGIRDEFVFVHGGYEKIEVVYDEKNKTHQIANKELKKRWQDHHRDVAVLVAMTPEEHSKHHYNR